MSDEVRAAAERLRAGQMSYPMWPMVRWPDAFAGDVKTLAYAYLSEHPADDGEPITEEWLRSVGMHNTNTPTYWRFIGFDETDIVKWTGGWNFRIHSGQNCKTRGDVRRLCAALGIALKEPNA